MSPTHEISFVVPVYNEAQVLPLLIERLNGILDKLDGTSEVILVDDGSSDTSPAMMTQIATLDNRYQSIFLSRNYGHQRALRAGLENTRGKYVMVLDADLQDPPELVFDFLKKVREGFDVVYGIRTERKEGKLKVFAYKSFYWMLRKISNYPIPRDSGDFCVMTRKVVNAILRVKEESLYLRGVRSWVGFKQAGVPYERAARAAGEAKYTLRMLSRLAYDGIFNFSVFPIKLLTLSGMLCISSSVIYFIWTVIRKYFIADVPLGFTALLFVIILFGGVQLLSMGILGEYIHRIFFQVKGRPLFFVRRKIIDGQEHEE